MNIHMFTMSSDGTWSKTITVRERFARINNNEVHTHVDGGWFVRIPGFKYDDFNRAGHLSVVKVDRLSQNVAGVQLVNKRILELLLFVVGRHWTFSPRLYQRAAVNFPMVVQWNCTGVGNASFDQRQVYYEDGHSRSTSAPTSVDDEPLATCIYRLVNVDPVTRQPTPLPEFVTDTVKKTAKSVSQRFPTLRPPTLIPDGRYRCRVAVRHDDTDRYFHTNGSAYLGFVLECASNAAKAGYYSTIDDDIAFYRARKMTSLYVSESRVGDELDVSTWEDADNSMLLNFTVSKDERMIFFAQIEYYDNIIFTRSQL